MSDVLLRSVKRGFLLMLLSIAGTACQSAGYCTVLCVDATDTDELPLSGSAQCTAGWTKTYGGPAQDRPGTGLRETNDGGFILLADTALWGGKAGVLVLKTDSCGATEWGTVVGQGNDHGIDVLEVEPSGYVVLYGRPLLNYSRTNSYLTELGSDGTVMWTSELGQDTALSSIIAIPTGFAVAGCKYTVWSKRAPVFMLLDNQGTVLSQRTWGEKDESVESLIAGASGGYVALCAGHDGEGDFIELVQLDELGGRVGVQVYSASPERCANPSIAPVAFMRDGGWLLCRSCGSWQERQITLLRYDADGELAWEANLPEVHNNWYGSYAITATQDGAVAVSFPSSSDGPGPDETDLKLLRLDAVGNQLWEEAFALPGAQGVGALAETDDGGFIISAQTDAVSDRALSRDDTEIVLIRYCHSEQ